MRRARRLRSLQRSACKRLQRLRNIITALAPTDSSQFVETQLSYVTIEALNTWMNFVRAYYLSGLLGAKRTGTGRIGVTYIVTNENTAIGLAVVHWRPTAAPKTDGSWDRRDEPTWHDPSMILPIFTARGFANIADIQAAVSSGTRVFQDLPVFRNYYAHRNRRTSKAAADLATLHGIPATTRPSEVLIARALGRPQSLILDWIDDLRFTIEYICY